MPTCQAIDSIIYFSSNNDNGNYGEFAQHIFPAHLSRCACVHPLTSKASLFALRIPDSMLARSRWHANLHAASSSAPLNMMDSSVVQQNSSIIQQSVESLKFDLLKVEEVC
jgi:hypothetical protein